MAEYAEEDYLLISGIQHYVFCPRQWALIHIESQWTENYLTASGRVLHNRAHEARVEKRGDCLNARALQVACARLGIVGECDVVEFRKNKEGVRLPAYGDELYLPYPVEYKRGKLKIEDCDRLQLCAQAVCLEEMLGCVIREGALFYGEPRRREICVFTRELRERLESVTEAMHTLFERQYTPKGNVGKQCGSCSLRDECLPKLSKKTDRSVSEYLEGGLE